MNIIGTLDEIRETTSYLKSEFEMKDLGKTRFCLRLELEHQACGILIHQSAYVHKILRKFNMDKVHPASTHMIGRSLYVQKDPFRPKEDDEEVLGAEIPYLSAIGALLYLKGTIDMGLFYPYEEVRKTASGNATPYTETPNNVLVGFADAGSIITDIRGTCGMSSTTDEPTSIYEDNASCIEKMKHEARLNDIARYDLFDGCLALLLKRYINTFSLFLVLIITPEKLVGEELLTMGHGDEWLRGISFNVVCQCRMNEL
ncbi:uncharacterized protein LOC113360073 [Papaver somniferum]|uniref:uncharacterized protein LOC113360073 n=1 Tax=Papaver somniferum TaxID=3469 RepID=UPI000E705987|nr:uncharacterized protein LOC113360073 [Papaver somniferum]